MLVSITCRCAVLCHCMLPWIHCCSSQWFRSGVGPTLTALMGKQCPAHGVKDHAHWNILMTWRENNHLLPMQTWMSLFSRRWRTCSRACLAQPDNAKSDDSPNQMNQIGRIFPMIQIPPMTIWRGRSLSHLTSVSIRSARQTHLMGMPTCDHATRRPWWKSPRSWRNPKRAGNISRCLQIPPPTPLQLAQSQIPLTRVNGLSPVARPQRNARSPGGRRCT